MVVVGLRSSGKGKVAVVLVFMNVASEYSKESPVVPFSLTVGLPVMCRDKNDVRTHKLANVFKKPQRKLRSVKRKQCLWWTASEDGGLAEYGSSVSGCSCS